MKKILGVYGIGILFVLLLTTIVCAVMTGTENYGQELDMVAKIAVIFSIVGLVICFFFSLPDDKDYTFITGIWPVITATFIIKFVIELKTKPDFVYLLLIIMFLANTIFTALNVAKGIKLSEGINVRKFTVEVSILAVFINVLIFYFLPMWI